MLGSPAPLPASLCVHSEECTQAKFLRDLFLLAEKGREEAGCPCPRPRKQQRNMVGPSWSGPGAYHIWDPNSGAGIPGACCGETLSLQQGCRGGVASEGTTDSKDPMHGHFRLSPSFAASPMLQGRLESTGPALARRAGDEGTR